MADRDGPFVLSRPPYFSPAAAAQDRAGSGSFGHFAQMMLPAEYTSWPEESVAHTRSCYLGDWSPLHKVRIGGAGALGFLGWLGMNDLSRFDVGALKHHVQLDENGWVASEGILGRLGEAEFLYTAGSANWLLWQLGRPAPDGSSWDAVADDVSPDQFIFGVQGPQSIAVVEAACGTSLRDLAFNRSRDVELAGVAVRVQRTGISGELGYELHGPADAGNDVWSHVVAVGAAHDLVQLGFRAMSVQHIEAGIATNGLDYLGRDALERDPGSRTLVGLTWDAGDVGRVLAAMVDGGGSLDPMELPRHNGLSFDQVLSGDEPVGVSSGRAYSGSVGATISLAAVDVARAAPGTGLTVRWGRAGTRQLPVRAVVTTLPFTPDRRRTDVTAL